jgi:hypothetical protein
MFVLTRVCCHVQLSDIVSQQPTETQLMTDALGTLSDPQASSSDKEAALVELQVLVEPIDNANGELTNQ